MCFLSLQLCLCCVCWLFHRVVLLVLGVGCLDRGATWHNLCSVFFVLVCFGVFVPGRCSASSHGQCLTFLKAFQTYSANFTLGPRVIDAIALAPFSVMSFAVELRFCKTS